MALLPKCNLQNVTALDVPTDNWNEDAYREFNITYYQRDCL